MNNNDTTWETSSSWYDKIVGSQGHYYHQQVIIPGVLKLLEEEKKPQGHLLDLACGQGILARHLPKGMKYLGIDGSESLIQSAKKYDSRALHQFFVHNLSYPLELPYKEFSPCHMYPCFTKLVPPFATFKNCLRTSA